MWDAAGNPKFNSVCSAYLRGMTAALLVYDVGSESSFAAISSWLERIREQGKEDAVKVPLHRPYSPVSRSCMVMLRPRNAQRPAMFLSFWHRCLSGTSATCTYPRWALFGRLVKLLDLG
jgi:hypothetical protein